MAARFINIDRQTTLLLPPDLRDWVAEGDLVHFVIEAVERLPLSTFAVNERGSGDPQFPPAMLLALLIYCYANGLFGSRRIERATYRDVAVRYLCADTHPDHDTICTFRRRNLAAVAAAFVEVLELARELRLLKLGGVSLDGTHLRASASKDKNVTYQRACQLRAQLRLDVDALLAQAEASDREDADPQALPAEIARREKLLGKMDAACAQLEARAKARAQAEQAEYERKVAARAAREGSSKGPEPRPPSATPEPDEQINLSDPDARLMRKSKREGYTQSYNAQAVVDADGSQLIVGQRVSTRSASLRAGSAPPTWARPKPTSPPSPRASAHPPPPWPIAATPTKPSSNASAASAPNWTSTAASTAKTPTPNGATTGVRWTKSKPPKLPPTPCSSPWPKSCGPPKAKPVTVGAPAASSPSSASSKARSGSGSSCCGA
jgi:transposase